MNCYKVIVTTVKEIPQYPSVSQGEESALVRTPTVRTSKESTVHVVAENPVEACDLAASSKWEIGLAEVHTSSCHEIAKNVVTANQVLRHKDSQVQRTVISDGTNNGLEYSLQMKGD